MSRLPRLTVPGHPHHVIQRGNNRQPIFTTADERAYWLRLLMEHSRAMRVAVHGYVLMDNHFHLLATPEGEQGLSGLMQAIGRQYVRYFNERHARTGTLWEGRYRSTVLEAERYLLHCMAYMDLNPVREGLVDRPAAYEWSSHRHYCGLALDPVVTAHPVVWRLGNTPFAREQAYRERVDAGLPAELCERITGATLRGWALGEAAFVAELQVKSARRMTPLKPGRPRRT